MCVVFWDDASNHVLLVNASHQSVDIVTCVRAVPPDEARSWHLYIFLSHPPDNSPFFLLHTYLVAKWAHTNAFLLAESPALHSAVRACYQSPSGAWAAQFLMVTLTSPLTNKALRELGVVCSGHLSLFFISCSGLIAVAWRRSL